MIIHYATKPPSPYFTRFHDKKLTIWSSHSPQNMIGQSQSGTGKTAAFVLTMLSRVDYSINKPQVRSTYVVQGCGC